MKFNFSSLLIRVVLWGGIGSATGQTIYVPTVQPTPIQVPQIVVPRVQPTPIYVPPIVRDPIVRPAIVRPIVQPTPIAATPIVVPQVQATPIVQLPAPGTPTPPNTVLYSSAEANPRRDSFFSLPSGLANQDYANSLDQWETAVFGSYRMNPPY